MPFRDDICCWRVLPTHLYLPGPATVNPQQHAHCVVPLNGTPCAMLCHVLAANVLPMQVGRRSVLFACSWALLVSCVELTTTLAMHTWLGCGFLALRRTKVD